MHLFYTDGEYYCSYVKHYAILSRLRPVYGKNIHLYVVIKGIITIMCIIVEHYVGYDLSFY